MLLTFTLKRTKLCNFPENALQNKIPPYFITFFGTILLISNIRCRPLPLDVRRQMPMPTFLLIVGALN